MALANLQVLGASSLHSVRVTTPLIRVQARDKSRTLPDAVTFRPRRLCRIQHLPCSGNFLSPARGGLIRFHRPHALSLQMITADHENSGEQDPELSSETALEATDSLTELQEEENLKQIFVVSLQGLQERLKELRERGMLESAKLGYQDAQEKVQNLDAKQLITDFKSSQLSNHAAGWWQTSDPWIKWPIAVFVPFCLLVTIFFGLAVSQDLLPLWILGPLITGIVIRQICRAAELSRVVAEKTADRRTQLNAASLALYRDAKEGTLPEKVKLLAESTMSELKERVSTKRTEITIYVSSGQAATGAKVFLVNRASDVGDFAAEQYADYMEWWRPKGRAVSRWLKKIF